MTSFRLENRNRVRDCFDVNLLGRLRKPDVNMQSAVFGCESEVRESLLESLEVPLYLGDRGRIVSEDPGHQFKRVGVPVFGHARLLEHLSKIARCSSLGESLQSLHQVPLVEPHEAPLVRHVPVRKAGVFVCPVERVVDLDFIREKKSLSNVQDLAAVCSIAVSFEMYVHLVLEADVIALRRVGGGCCKTPAHVLLA